MRYMGCCPARLGTPGSTLKPRSPWQVAQTSDEVLVVVQVNGKLRAKFTIGADTDEDQIKKTALADERIIKYVQDKEVRKIIVIRKKQTLVNIVV